MPNNNPKGRGGFASHPENINRNGRPSHPDVDELRAAIKEVEHEKKKTLYKHMIELAWDDPRYKGLLIEVLKKRVPSTQNIDFNGITLEDLVSIFRNNKGSVDE